MAEKNKDKKEAKEADKMEKQVTMEVVERGRRKLLEFASEEDRAGWEKAFRKSKWYTPYFLIGIGINLLLYRLGVDLTRNIALGALVGISVPIISMFALAELHYTLVNGRKQKKLKGGAPGGL